MLAPESADSRGHTVVHRGRDAERADLDVLQRERRADAPEEAGRQRDELALAVLGAGGAMKAASRPDAGPRPRARCRRGRSTASTSA